MFLGIFKRNSNKKALKRKQLKERLHNVWVIDNVTERGHCTIKAYLKYGAFGYQCMVSPEPLCWVGKENEAKLRALAEKWR